MNLRPNQTRKLTLIPFTVVLALLLAACMGADMPGSGVPQVMNLSSPQNVAEAFLEDWNARNYQAMYERISPQSQQMYSFETFRQTYAETDASLSTENFTYTINEAREQGMTASVHYDMLFNTATFGEINDLGRIMRLIETPNGWRVAWSQMDIFDGLTEGARLAVEVRRQPRAHIYDRDGDFVVEQEGALASMYTSRDGMANEVDCAYLLSSLTLEPYDNILESFTDYVGETLFYVGELDVPTANANAEALAETCGIFEGPPWRYERTTRRYADQGAAVHITGYIGQIRAEDAETLTSQGYSVGDLIGLAGIEQAYETQLSGRGESFLRIVESGGVTVRDLASAPGVDPEPLQLTIDMDLQRATMQAIQDAYNYATPNWGGRSPGASAVVLDVDTGAVLAMASYPAFDPSAFNPDTPIPFVGEYIADLNADERRPLINKVIQEQYSPGSVYKIVTTAAAAAESIVAPNEIFYCGLEWDGSSLGDTFGIRSDWRKTDELPPTGDITISQALTSSCDPFYYEMGAKLYNQDPQILIDYSRRLGLGSATGVDLPEPEASGQLPPPNNVSEAVNNAIGQGDVQTSPIQMAVVTAAIANGGTVYEPYIVQQIGGLNGVPVSFRAEPTVAGEANLSQQVINIVRRGMCDVTTDPDIGTAEWVFREAPFTVCGKTGTAQTARIEPNAWFVAYTPAQNPEIAIAVMVQHSREGSEVAAPITRRIIESYYGVPYYDYPEWWAEEYIPLNIPEGGTGG